MTSPPQNFQQNFLLTFSLKNRWWESERARISRSSRREKKSFPLSLIYSQKKEHFFNIITFLIISRDLTSNQSSRFFRWTWDHFFIFCVSRDFLSAAPIIFLCNTFLFTIFFLLMQMNFFCAQINVKLDREKNAQF